MEYTVIVEVSGDVVLRFQGYAENPSDALYKALEQRENEVVAEFLKAGEPNIVRGQD